VKPSRRAPAPAASKGRRITTIVRDPALVAERHAQIFQAASRVFISRGYHQATVREIAEAAGLSLGSLYSYIRTKEDILYLVFEKLTTVLRRNIREAIEEIDDPVEQMRAALFANLETTERYQDEILLMYQETKSLDRESLHHVLSGEAGYVQFFEEILEAGYRRGVFAGDPRLSADIITYLCSLVALRRWNVRRRFRSEQVRDGLVAFVLRGLGVRDERGDAGAPLARP
jgi:AcrR family transcriptional regulator